MFALKRSKPAAKHTSRMAPMVCPLCARLVEGMLECPHDGAIPRPTTDPRVGSIVGNYRVHGALGEGGMGSVYRGEHLVIGKELAIKVLKPEAVREPKIMERFLLEAKACSRIHHPNVVEVSDFGALPDGAPFLVMELVRGQNLADEIDGTGALPFHRTVAILRQVCEGLHACHGSGVVHRDLKPENIVLIRRTGEDLGFLGDFDPVIRLAGQRDGFYEQVKVVDFGIAQVGDLSAAIDAESQRAQVVFGSPYYLSPEQARGQPGGPLSDIYSIGVILFEMLTGDVPYGGEDPREVMLNHIQSPVPRLSEHAGGLPPRLDEIVLRAMAKQPRERFPDVHSFHKELTFCFLDAGLHRVPGMVAPRVRTRILGSNGGRS